MNRRILALYRMATVVMTALIAIPSLSQDAKTKPIPLTMEELLKNAKRYLGKRVTVEGYLITNRFNNSVFYDTMENAYFRKAGNSKISTYIVDCPLLLDRRAYPVHMRVYAIVHNETGVLHELTRIDLLPIDKEKANELFQRDPSFAPSTR